MLIIHPSTPHVSLVNIVAYTELLNTMTYCNQLVNNLSFQKMHGLNLLMVSNTSIIIFVLIMYKYK